MNDQPFEQGYEAQLEARADAAIDNLQRGQQWGDWLVFGEYLAMARNRCMAQAGTNQPVGAKYNNAMNGWLSTKPKVTKIDKVSRSHAVWCFDNREALQKLRENMGATKAMLKNHPTVMKRAFDAEQRASQKGEASSKRPTTSKADLEQQVVLLADEAEKWKQKAQAADALFDLKADSVKMIVGVIAQEVSQNRLMELAKALKAEADRRAKIKNGKVT